MKYWRKREVVLVAAFVVLLATVFSTALRQTRISTSQQVESALKALLNSTHEALLQWVDLRRKNVSELAQNPFLVEQTLELLKQDASQETLLACPQTELLREFFFPILSQNNDRGMFIINRQYISIASMRDANIGSVNLIAQDRPELMQSVFRGNVEMIPPIRSDVPLRDKNGNFVENYPTMFILAPILENGNVVAALAVRIDPAQSFSRILSLGHFGESGEAYAFDQHGVLLSDIRFEEEVYQKGILPAGSNPVTSLKLYDPTTDQQLTFMAQNALQGQFGSNAKGYRDYRGVDVFGAWLWDHSLRIGLTTEVDKAEALQAFYFMRRLLTAIFIGVSFLAFLLLNYMVRLRAKSENLLIKANLELEDRVMERTRELEESNATKDRFFSIIAHDLKNPVNNILGFSEILSSSFENFSDKQKVSFSKFIFEASSEVYKLLENLLEWARSQTQSIEVKPEPFVLKALAVEAITLIKHAAREKNIEIDLATCEDVEVLADRNMIATVLRNLISNAIKFTPSGGKVTVKCIAKHDMALVEVQDTGVGIPDDILEKLFKIEEKISTKGTERETGTGLGLILSKEFVEKNNGEVCVESQEGQGSRFFFTLPIA